MAIAAHYVPACAPSAESAPEQLELIALGDFDRDNDSVAILASDAASRGVELPAGTRAAELNSLGDGAYWGSGRLTPDNRLPIVLWPHRQACTLGRLERAASAESGAWLLGASTRLDLLLVTGPEVPGQSTATGAAAGAVDLASGDFAPLDGDRGPRHLRREASLSELADGLVLAGGIDATTGRVLGDAERFEPVLGRFSSETISLTRPRARHAALGLPSGSSLLIGGESESGQALGSVEIVTTDTSRASRAFELLRDARVAPHAVLLGPNRILVGGGYRTRSDGTREPLGSVEFLSTDLTDVTRAPIDLDPPALDRSFVALGSGGALAAGGCAAASGAADCIPCAEGCVSRELWWIDPQGTPHALEPLPLPLSVPDPKLVPGAGGSPWLLARGRFGHFDPWLGRFEIVEVGRPAAGSTTLLGEPVSIGPGLFAWLEATADGAELVGLYHSQRGPYAQDVAPLLVGSGAGIVPHRPVTGSADIGIRLAYSAATGLELSGSAAVASIADTDYAAFTLELSLSSGPPPLIALAARDGDGAGAGAAFGGLDCPWPAFDVIESSDGTDPRRVVRLRVQRTLDRVRLERLDATEPIVTRPEPCRQALPERVSIELVGTPTGVTRLSRVEIRRSVD